MRRAIAGVVALVASAGLALASAAPAGAGGPLFAAIAVERQAKHYGYGFNYPTQAGAEGRALEECRVNAVVPDNCRGIVWVRNGCAAVAYKRREDGRLRHAWGIGESKAQAIRRSRGELGQGARKLVATCTKGYE